MSLHRTLLIGDHASSWREWLKTNKGGRDFLCLDPSDPLQSPPGRFTLHRADKLQEWRFYGSLDPLRAPHIALAALSKALKVAAGDLVIQMPAYRPSPLMRQFLFLVAELAQPDEILISRGLSLEQQGFSVGPEEIDLEEAFLDVVRNAQRKAQWLKLIEDGEDHVLEFSKLTIEGARLGSGRKMPVKDIDAHHLEACGSTLLIVADKHPEDREVARALDAAHCSRAHIVEASAYHGLLCSFARQTGQDFGMGLIQEIDFQSGLIRARCTAVAPAPVRILRIGGLQLDMAGNELGDVRPWQV